MADSLRDQLLKSGLAKELRKDKPRPPKGRRTGGGKGKPKARDPKGGGDIDLARAYAIRAREENDERRRAQREAEEKARQRKELKRKLEQALDGHALNKPDAELMRHFEYGGKIRRVHVDAGQLQAINRGELGVIQYRGRYVLVERRHAEEIAGFAPDNVALLVDPDAPSSGDDVPDDLVW